MNRVGTVVAMVLALTSLGPHTALATRPCAQEVQRRALQQRQRAELRQRIRDLLERHSGGKRLPGPHSGPTEFNPPSDAAATYTFLFFAAFAKAGYDDFDGIAAAHECSFSRPKDETATLWPSLEISDTRVILHVFLMPLGELEKILQNIGLPDLAKTPSVVFGFRPIDGFDSLPNTRPTQIEFESVLGALQTITGNVARDYQQAPMKVARAIKREVTKAAGAAPNQLFVDFLKTRFAVPVLGDSN